MEKGKYKVLLSPMPGERFWTCGDGCCCDWEYDDVYYPVGSEIYVDDEQLGPDTYEVGSDYEGKRDYHYRPHRGTDYVKEGFLELVPPSEYELKSAKWLEDGVDDTGYPYGVYIDYDHDPETEQQ